MSCLTCRYISWIEIISMPKNKYEHDWIYDEVGIYKSDYDRTFLLYRKDRLRRSLELKNARTEAGTTTRRSLD